MQADVPYCIAACVCDCRAGGQAGGIEMKLKESQELFAIKQVITNIAIPQAILFTQQLITRRRVIRELASTFLVKCKAFSEEQFFCAASGERCTN